MPQHARIRRRGIAMVMVMVVVVATGIMAYAMLASTSIRAQVAAASTTRLQRQYLAESGLNLALYYLQNPTASPLDLVDGEGGNMHYPGEAALQLPDMPGTITITVSNPENGLFQITSVAELEGGSSSKVATVRMTKSRTFEYAVNASGDLTLNSNTTITGGVLTDGEIDACGADLSGNILAENGTELGGQNTGDVEYRYPVSTLNYLPYYFHNGKRYEAARVPSIVIGTLLDLDVVNNPCNVWYIDRNTKFIGTTVVGGTLIAKPGTVITVQGAVSVTARTDMPALVTGGDVKFVGNSRSLSTNGLTYIGGKVQGQGSTNKSRLDVSGALVCEHWPVQDSFDGEVNINYDPERVTTSAIFDEIEKIDTFTVESWGANP